VSEEIGEKNSEIVWCNIVCMSGEHRC